jgi:hypothetical protein
MGRELAGFQILLEAECNLDLNRGFARNCNLQKGHKLRHVTIEWIKKDTRDVFRARGSIISRLADPRVPSWAYASGKLANRI